jgi:small subunit ribosomal protein S9
MEGNTLSSLRDVKTALESQEPERNYKDSRGRVYATGRRKTAVARVWLFPGPGAIRINGKKLDDYFVGETLRGVISFPLEKMDRSQQYSVECTVKGGGLSGQAGAVRHGISRALCRCEGDLRGDVKQLGLLTRDDRKVERKKPGRKKARRKFQFSKR